jgi:hypothetical protein
MTEHSDPDHDMTRAERSILLVLCDPAHMSKSVTEKAKIAGVSRTHWYRVNRSGRLPEAARESVRGALQRYVGPAVAALGSNAGNPDPRCARDRRLFFELIRFGDADEPMEALQRPRSIDTSTDSLVAAFRSLDRPLPETLRLRAEKEGVP